MHENAKNKDFNADIVCKTLLMKETKSYSDYFRRLIKYEIFKGKKHHQGNINKLKRQW